MTVSEFGAAATASSIFTDRHTAYRFAPEPVSDAELGHVYDLAKFTPTALNSQPLRVTFVRTAEGRARLLPLLAESNRDAAASAPVIAILAADIDFHVHLPSVYPQLAGARERLAANEASRTRMAFNNAWLQAGGFILAVRAAGLDAGPLGAIDLPGIDREFFTGTSLRTFLVVNIGHAAEDGVRPRDPRLRFDQAVTLA